MLDPHNLQLHNNDLPGGLCGSGGHFALHGGIACRTRGTAFHAGAVHASPPIAVHMQVNVSLAAVAAFGLTVLPALLVTTGPLGLFKFWLMPWLGYHFWMSTFTVVHHTAPHIPFKPASEWNAAEAQLSGTVHCDYPKW